MKRSPLGRIEIAVEERELKPGGSEEFHAMEAR